ncbi:Maf family nucleotide pyrophosphatase [Sphingobacterium sp. SYP-B4668]|uniref:Maf family nucleotide pyrophosphatase n=1 Tax=Sphingobacterium sp. SYP-B4668 TaxID=2996035 RepID=UPI0022DDC0F2|nr:Maf family protein [Sphingobacterium sp. SYP-B4668]
MLKNLENISIVLGSQSPRRSELLKAMGVHFEVVVKTTDESYDEALSPKEIAVAIAEKKASAFQTTEFQDKLVITADTIVVANHLILGKPKDSDAAKEMLSLLSGNTHEVMSAVTLLWKGQVNTFVEVTAVTLNPLTDDEIAYYVNQYQPFDKAGSYGIQEWIGLVGILKLEGTYTNVVGLPTARLYQELKKI